METVHSAASPDAEAAAELVSLPDRFRALDIEISGQILEVNSLGGFLAWLDAYNGDL